MRCEECLLPPGRVASWLEEDLGVRQLKTKGWRKELMCACTCVLAVCVCVWCVCVHVVCVWCVCVRVCECMCACPTSASPSKNMSRHSSAKIAQEGTALGPPQSPR